MEVRCSDAELVKSHRNESLRGGQPACAVCIENDDKANLVRGIALAR